MSLLARGSVDRPKVGSSRETEMLLPPLGFVVTGLPALLIILVILAVIVAGVISLGRLTARGATKIADGSGE